MNGATIDVLLLRDMPEQGLRSMERFADELEGGFAGHPCVRVSSTAVRASRIAALPGLRQLDSYWKRFVWYPWTAKGRTANVYHIVDHGYGHVAMFLPPERTVISCHDLMLLRASEGSAGFRPRRVSLARLRWSVSFLRRAARVVCPTEATKRDAVRFVGLDPGRIVVAPYGVHPRFRPLDEAARAAARGSLPVSAERVVLQVSTGRPYKNTPGALRVVAALRRSGLDVALVRAGRPLDAEQRALARSLGLDGAVADCGFVPDERLIELYNASDALLFPSFWEGFGWPPLEAMACGTPVVASNCDSLVEVLGDAALMAAPDDEASLAAALRAILESPDVARRMRALGLRRAERFRLERTIQAFARVYEEVACGAMGREAA